MKEFIESAAIIHKDKPYSVSRPGRHHDVIRLLANMFPNDIPITGTQGFMTNTGRFVNRSEGAKIAIAANQVKPIVDSDGIESHRFDPNKLFSEDMW